MTRYERIPNRTRRVVSKARRQREPSYRRSYASTSRSRRIFSLLVRANVSRARPPILLTLTMFEPVAWSLASRRFKDFVSRLRRRHGSRFSYIAVPEFQKRGAIHYHVLIFGLEPSAQQDRERAQTERTARYFARLWGWGFCDCVITDGSPALAGYLAKYMHKAMQDQRIGEKKAYLASGNILRPMRTPLLTQGVYDIVSPEVIPTLPPQRVREYVSHYMGRVNITIYDLGL